MSEKYQIQKAKDVILRIVNGIDPISGKTIPKDSFLNEPDIIRCLYYTCGILEDLLDGIYSKRNNIPFSITTEQKKAVTLPEGKIGINEFARCVNSALDIWDKRLTGTELNKKLKLLNILSEIRGMDGKTNTVINDNSHLYGFEMEHRAYRDREYDKVLINDAGKNYLMENLEKIMGIKIPA